jgi:CO dehydrogenase maturation factor
MYMKIAFVGKGGSGKTALSSLFSRWLAGRGFPVLAIDADINQHMAVSLGMDEVQTKQIPPMGVEAEKIKDYVKGVNVRLANSPIIKTTPPGKGSRLLRITESNPVFDYFARNIHGVDVVVVGPFDESDLGVKCYHSKTGSVELLLNHLVDREHEYVVVDMTAGADSFASGLFTRFDITFIVVEPTKKSVSVYEQYKAYAKEHNVVIRVIANKIENEEDISFVRKYVGDDLVAAVSFSPFIKKIDRGEQVPFVELEETTKKELEKMITVVDVQKKDWQKFYRQAVEFHIKNATSWANQEMGEDLQKQIDPDFDMAKAASAQL